MRIGIDGSALTIPFPCGTKTYAEGLISALAEIDKTNEYYIFAPNKIPIPKNKNFHIVVYPKILPILKRQLWMILAVKRQNIDIFHYLDSFGSIFLNNVNIVTTVNDTKLGVIYPKYRSVLYIFNRYYCEIMLYFVIKHSKKIITISNFVKRELKEYISKNKLKCNEITTIYDAFSDDYKKMSVKKENYLLCMGDYSPRKNIPAVFKAYSMLADNIKAKHPLRVIVSTKKESLRFKVISKKLGINHFVKFDINITNKRLCELYNKARAFLFPSIYEGFGIPILEAMACGCPVITSDCGAMKEIAAKSAILVKPHNTDEISRAMMRILSSSRLQEKYIKLGLARSHEFSWRKTATKTLKIYNSFKS